MMARHVSKIELREKLRYKGCTTAALYRVATDRPLATWTLCAICDSPGHAPSWITNTELWQR